MQPLIKTRTLVQIRTHAQKVFKKIGLKKLNDQNDVNKKKKKESNENEDKNDQDVDDLVDQDVDQDVDVDNQQDKRQDHHHHDDENDMDEVSLYFLSCEIHLLSLLVLYQIHMLSLLVILVKITYFNFLKFLNSLTHALRIIHLPSLLDVYIICKIYEKFTYSNILLLFYKECR